MKQKKTNRPINNTGPEPLRVPFLKGRVRARHGSAGRVVIGVRNSNRRAEETAEIGVGRRRREDDAGVVAAAAYDRGGVQGLKMALGPS